MSKLEIIKVTYYRLYKVTFKDGNEGEITKEAGYFSDEKEANKVASLPRGCYGSKGNVYIVDFKETDVLPKHWNTAAAWAKNNITVVEFESIDFNQ